MPQIFHVIRCVSCGTFQVHQVKKSTKWNCKLCGEKQSIKKVYAQGSGIDCRKTVQTLNMGRGKADTQVDLLNSPDDQGDLMSPPDEQGDMLGPPDEGNDNSATSSSLWDKYIPDAPSLSDEVQPYEPDPLVTSTTDRGEFKKWVKNKAKGHRGHDDGDLNFSKKRKIRGNIVEDLQIHNPPPTGRAGYIPTPQQTPNQGEQKPPNPTPGHPPQSDPNSKWSKYSKPPPESPTDQGRYQGNPAPHGDSGSQGGGAEWSVFTSGEDSFLDDILDEEF